MIHMMQGLQLKFVSLNNIFGTEWYLKAIINMTIDNIIAAVAFKLNLAWDS